MEVPTISSRTVPGASSTGSTKPGNKDTFLQLLVAQLKHQDPLSPLDNAEFTAQLAQFSALEQMEAMNTRLDLLLATQQTSTKVQTASFLGATVKAQGNTVQLASGKDAELSYQLAAESAKVTISIFNDSGNLIKRIEQSKQEAGEHVVKWNGKDDQGNKLPAGEYIFAVAAEDKAGKPVGTDTFIKGIVEGIEYMDSGLYLIVDGNRVGLTSLINIKPTE